MNNFSEIIHEFSAQADEDGAVKIPLNTADRPMHLDSVMYRLDAVAGSPTAVTLDVTLTDDETTRVAINGQSIGTAAGQGRLVPTDADKFDGDHIADQDEDAQWYASLDFNFTGGSTPTVTGRFVLRFAQ